MTKFRNLLGHALPFLVALLLPINAFSQGGPPLVTDDPGTPGDGNWEVNIAAQWSKSDTAAILQMPLFDINYGYGDHIQLNVNTSLITATPKGESSATGLSVASVGIKWRFIGEEQLGWAMSTYPRVDFNHALASDNPLLNSPGTRYFLPFEFVKKWVMSISIPRSDMRRLVNQSPNGSTDWRSGICIKSVKSCCLNSMAAQS